MDNAHFIKYKIYNNNSNEITVLLPGYCDGIDTFKPLRETNKNSNYILINYPMHKLGTKKAFRIESLAQYVIDILKELNIEKCNLVGFSIGGLIGIEIAHRYPSLVKSLVLVSSYPKLLHNKVREFLAYIIFPIVNSAPFLFLVSRINTNLWIRDHYKMPPLTKYSTDLMLKNYKTLFGTLVKSIYYNGTKKYKNISASIKKSIHITKGDPILKIEKLYADAKRNKINFHIHPTPTHTPDKQFFSKIAGLLI